MPHDESPRPGRFREASFPSLHRRRASLPLRREFRERAGRETRTGRPRRGRAVLKTRLEPRSDPQARLPWRQYNSVYVVFRRRSRIAASPAAASSKLAGSGVTTVPVTLKIGLIDVEENVFAGPNPEGDEACRL